MQAITPQLFHDKYSQNSLAASNHEWSNLQLITLIFFMVGKNFLKNSYT
ncbi:hypothetical protein OTSTA716_1564 [Orientia tsutsugamushi str. TA716]|uniref:Uncharacterized protein n=1 Tax=Orientia tsutsugamushi str. TA716 TaxID=1359175 RepID=A0A0F3NZP8_ORITS|nr:hypothetical protein OTSTA716_2463 [Orientia tsutsugamushi str. TA716]KJV73565.1 hypothetical protein OTSTA716_1564 [Orientia tsutsugamushi str. TA716]